MMNMQYFLSEACQNTFVFADLAHEKALSDEQLKHIHRYLLESNRDDAIILLNGEAQGTSTYRVDMVVLGRDGHLGAFCGNGARVCAAYLFQSDSTFKRVFIKDAHLEYELFKYTDELYAVQFPQINFAPTDYFQGKRIQQENGYFKYEVNNRVLYYADAIEPHLILEEQISDHALEVLAKEINQDIDSFPFGINVTSYFVESTHCLQAKTYERGAQRITKSCGTGATCTAAFYLKGGEGLVTVVNPGGRLHIKHHNSLYELKGPACLSN